MQAKSSSLETKRSKKSLSENNSKNTSMDKEVDFLDTPDFLSTEDYTIFRRRYPKSRILPLRILTEWHIEVSNSEKPQICVVGLYKDMIIRTSPVQQTIGPRKIITNNCTYLLRDPSRVLEYDVEKGMNQLFINGFPSNWRDLLIEAFSLQDLPDSKAIGPLPYAKRDSLIHNFAFLRTKTAEYSEGGATTEGNEVKSSVVIREPSDVQEPDITKTTQSEIKNEVPEILPSVPEDPANQQEKGDECNGSISELLSSSVENHCTQSSYESCSEGNEDEKQPYLSVSEAVKRSVIHDKKHMRARRVSGNTLNNSTDTIIPLNNMWDKTGTLLDNSKRLERSISLPIETSMKDAKAEVNASIPEAKSFCCPEVVEKEAHQSSVHKDDIVKKSDTPKEAHENELKVEATEDDRHNASIYKNESNLEESMIGDNPIVEADEDESKNKWANDPDDSEKKRDVITEDHGIVSTETDLGSLSSSKSDKNCAEEDNANQSSLTEACNNDLLLEDILPNSASKEAVIEALPDDKDDGSDIPEANNYDETAERAKLGRNVEERRRPSIIIKAFSSSIGTLSDSSKQHSGKSKRKRSFVCMPKKKKKGNST